MLLFLPWTFLLIIAGALVTSNDAGLSVPDWPTSFGSWYKIPKLVGGVQFEHTHRMIAQAAGTAHHHSCRLVVAGRKAALVANPGLGRDRPGHRAGSSRGTDSEVLFASADLIGARSAGTDILLSCRRHRPLHRAEVDRGAAQGGIDQRRPSLFTLTLLAIFVLYVQLLLGAMFRHHGMSWWPHVVHAAVVSFVLAWTAVRALTVYPNVEVVRRPAILMLSLVIAQLCLGFTAF